MPFPVYPAGTTATAFLFLADLLEDARSSLPPVCSSPSLSAPPLSTSNPGDGALWSSRAQSTSEAEFGWGWGRRGGLGKLFREHCGAAYLCPLVRGPKIQNKTMLDEPKRGKGGTSNHPRSQQDAHGDANVGAARTQEPEAIPGFQGQRDQGKQASKGHAWPEAARRPVPLRPRCWRQRGAGRARRATLTELLQLRGHGLGAQGEGRGWSTLGRRGSLRGRRERQRCENLARMAPAPPPRFPHSLGAGGPEPAGKVGRRASPQAGEQQRSRSEAALGPGPACPP